eukprot:7260989-Pyramimonas_sp.AAC.1
MGRLRPLRSLSLGDLRAPRSLSCAYKGAVPSGGDHSRSSSSSMTVGRAQSPVRTTPTMR